MPDIFGNYKQISLACSIHCGSQISVHHLSANNGENTLYHFLFGKLNLIQIKLKNGIHIWMSQQIFEYICFQRISHFPHYNFFQVVVDLQIF